MRSEEVIDGCFFNAGVRTFDISDPYRPETLAWYIPPGPEGSRAPTAQTGFFVAFGKVSDPHVAMAREGVEVAARGGGLGRQVALDLAFRNGVQLTGVLRWIATPDEEDALIEDLLAAMKTAAPPFHGPYRAEGFHESLPG